MSISDANEPRWLTIDDVLIAHAYQIKTIGGLPGIRDHGLVASAVKNPADLWHYGNERDVLTLAVRCGMAIARNHGFNDGNKRTAAVALITFLKFNGYDLIMPDDTSLGRMIEAVIEHDMTEDQMAEHLDHYIYEADT